MKPSRPPFPAIRLPPAVRHPPSPAFLLSSFGFSLCLLLLPACAKRETAVAAGIRTQTHIVGNGGEPASLDPHVAGAALEVHIVKALL